MVSESAAGASEMPERALPARVEAVVIGVSAGAVHALGELLPDLPAETPFPVIVVCHLPPGQPSLLASLFSRRCALRVLEPADKEPVAPGIWFAPPDYHLLVEQTGVFSLSLDEPVNHSRPSIDVLFESAADAWGDRLLAIVLTGANDDGSLGARAVRAAGGHVIVQDPLTAEVASMPLFAIERAQPHWIAPLAQIAEALKRAALAPPPQEAEP